MPGPIPLIHSGFFFCYFKWPPLMYTHIHTHTFIIFVYSHVYVHAAMRVWRIKNHQNMSDERNVDMMHQRLHFKNKIIEKALNRQTTNNKH